MSIATLEINCPCCNTILIIDRATGEIIDVRKPLVKNSSGDRFTDALQHEKEHSQKIDGLFEESLSSLEKKKRERQKLFEENLKKTRKEGLGDFKPIKDIDLY